ncbi:MAG: murein biosynthesis integral membrane protein MurJ, partial [Gammaproteobacteria bacterium]
QLTKSASLVGFMTLLSRIMGFVRDILVATFFGAGAAYDAFLIAFKIPNFLRSLFAEGAFSQAFVPLLSEYHTKNNPAETRLFIDKVAGSLALVVLLIMGLMMLCAPLVIRIFAPGFDVGGERFTLATQMLYITAPYLFFISLTAFCGGILNTFNRFAIPALTPILLNLAMIGTTLWLRGYLDEPIYALAYGVLLGGILQLAIQIPYLWHLQLLPRAKIAFKDPAVKRLLALIAPLIFAASVVQVNLLVITIFASFLTPGSVSWLYYAERLMQFPLGVFGIALATVVLPHLSKQHAKQDKSNFNGVLDWALKAVCLIGIPASIALIVIARPLLTTLFQYGQFSAFDVLQSQGALVAFGFGLAIFIFIKILAAACYARQDVKAPVRIAVICLFANVALSAVLMQYFAHVGLAMSTTLSALLNASLLYARLYKDAEFRLQSPWLDYVLQLIMANAAMIYVLLIIMNHFGEWLLLDMKTRVLGLGLLVIAGGLTYFMVLVASGLRLRHLRAPMG